MGESGKTFLVGQEPDLYIALGRLLLEFSAAEEFISTLASAFTNGIHLSAPVIFDDEILKMPLKAQVAGAKKRIRNGLTLIGRDAANLGHDVRGDGESLCSRLELSPG